MKRLSQKILLYFALPTVLVITLLLVGLIYFYKSHAEQEFVERWVSYAQTFSRVVVQGTVIQNKTLINPIMSQYLEQNNVIGLAVCDPDGKTIAQMVKNNTDIQLPADLKGNVGHLIHEKKAIMVVVPINFISESLSSDAGGGVGENEKKSELVGYAVVKISNANFVKDVRQVVFSMILIFVLLLIQLYFLFLYLANRVTKPVTLLKENVLALEQGRAPHYENTIVRNEIGELEKAFRRYDENLRNKQKELDGHLLLLETRVSDRTRDLSVKNEDLAKLNKILEETKEDLLLAIKRGNFLSTNMAFYFHALKKPVSVVISYARLIEPYVHEPESKKFLSIICNEVLGVEQFIKKMEQLFHTSFTEIHLDQLIQSTIQQIGIAHNLTIVGDLHSGVTLEADIIQMRECLANILVNAIDAIKDRPPIIKVTTQKMDENVVIIVQDNGPGVPQAVIDKLYSGRMSYSARSGFKGFGLPSTRFMIEEVYGGQLKIRNREEGTEVQFIIPLKKRRPPEESQQ